MRTRDLASAIVLILGALGAGCHETHDVALDETDIKVLFETIGAGRAGARPGDIVCIDYRVTTPSNEELLWGKDFCFKLGAGATISGIDEAIPGMRAGGRRKVRCPAHKHWGRKGYGGRIPPQTSLIIDIRLTSIQPAE